MCGVSGRFSDLLMSHISAAVEHNPSLDVSPVDVMQAGYESCMDQACREVRHMLRPWRRSSLISFSLSSRLGSAWLVDSAPGPLAKLWPRRDGRPSRRQPGRLLALGDPRGRIRLPDRGDAALVRFISCFTDQVSSDGRSRRLTSFNCPYQLGTNRILPTATTPREHALEYTVPVQKSDIVILCSDGLIDNLVSRPRRSLPRPATDRVICSQFESEILEEVRSIYTPDGALDPALDPQRISEALCSRAKAMSDSTRTPSPFGAKASKAGFRHVGGKSDGTSSLGLRDVPGRCSRELVCRHLRAGRHHRLAVILSMSFHLSPPPHLFSLDQTNPSQKTDTTACQCPPPSSPFRFRSSSCWTAPAVLPTSFVAPDRPSPPSPSPSCFLTLSTCFSPCVHRLATPHPPHHSFSLTEACATSPSALSALPSLAN